MAAGARPLINSSAQSHCESEHMERWPRAASSPGTHKLRLTRRKREEKLICCEAESSANGSAHSDSASDSLPLPQGRNDEGSVNSVASPATARTKRRWLTQTPVLRVVLGGLTSAAIVLYLLKTAGQESRLFALPPPAGVGACAAAFAVVAYVALSYAAANALPPLGGSNEAAALLLAKVATLAGAAAMLRAILHPRGVLPLGWFHLAASKWWGPRGWLPAAAAALAAAEAIDGALELLSDQLAARRAQSQAATRAVARAPFSALALALAACLLGPLSEEILYRGFLLVSLTRWLTPPGALTLSSVVYALSHLDQLQDFWSLTLTACVLGAAYAWTGNLFAPLAARAAQNGAAILQALLEPPSEGQDEVVQGAAKSA